MVVCLERMDESMEVPGEPEFQVLFDQRRSKRFYKRVLLQNYFQKGFQQRYGDILTYKTEACFQNSFSTKIWRCHNSKS